MNKNDNNARLLQQNHQPEINGENSAYRLLGVLFDEGSFVELGAYVSGSASSEGVVTGYGTVDGRLVYAYAQDNGVIGGAIGSNTAKKVSNIIDMAVKTGSPLISILNSNGVRINEGIDVLSCIGTNLQKSAEISGIIPQIALVTGICAGSAVFTARLADFVFMTEKNSSVFLTGPDVTSGVTGVETDANSLGGSDVCLKNGIADFVFPSDEECIKSIKKLLDFLPSNNLEKPSDIFPDDDVNRLSQNISSLIPEDNSPYDIISLIKEVTDEGQFFEAMSGYAKSIVTGFARIGGIPSGIIANQPAYDDGALDIESSKKAAKFIRICDSYNIPIITFVDVPGFKAGADQEHGGISIYGASVLYAYAEATVPKISLIVRRAFGSASLAMGSKASGADIVLAYPDAKISIMPPEGAAGILYNDEIAAAPDPVAYRAEKIKEFEKENASVYAAAKNGFIDDVTEPSLTRPRLINTLDMLAGKRVERLPKKHGNMPV
jgi:acetyl-CoA carboxylase carboxyltransferase component